MKKPSGYSIYNQDVKRRTKHSKLSKNLLYPKLPNRKFDIIFDCSGKLRYTKAKRWLNQNGVFININARSISQIIKSIFSHRYHILFTRVKKDDLRKLSQLAAAGKIKGTISKNVKLEEAIEAITELENGQRSFGKAVVTPNE